MGKSNILIVEDDALVAMAIVDMLEELGHAVVEANAGDKALKILEERPSIDLMITDHAMPGMNGIQLAEAARRLRPDLPILLASGYVDLPDGDPMQLPRLDKPYDQSQLAREIDAILEAGPTGKAVE